MSKRLATVAVFLSVCLMAGAASAAVVEELTPVSNGVISIINASFDGHGTSAVAAIDGNLNSCFLSSDSDQGSWFIVLDLGAEYLIDHVDVAWRVTGWGCNSGWGHITVGNELTAGLRVVGAPGAVTDFGWNNTGGGVDGGQYFVTGTLDNTLVNAQYIDIYTAGSPWSGTTGGTYEIRIFGSLPDSEIPEPATLLLVGTGVLGVFGYARRRMMK